MRNGACFAQRSPRVTPNLGPQLPLWVPTVGLNGPFADGPTLVTEFLHRLSLRMQRQRGACPFVCLHRAECRMGGQLRADPQPQEGQLVTWRCDNGQMPVEVELEAEPRVKSLR